MLFVTFLYIHICLLYRYILSLFIDICQIIYCILSPTVTARPVFLPLPYFLVVVFVCALVLAFNCMATQFPR